MPNQYPYRYNTTQGTASQDDPRYETPGGAQDKADVALDDAKEYTDAFVGGTANLADDSVTRPKIAPGAVGAIELDPSLLDYTTDIAVAAKFNEVDAQLADIADQKVVNVEDFSGANALIKIQNAINFAIANNSCLEFTKMYDISGLGSVQMVKTYPYLGTLYLIGNGGGIVKEDSGFIFENPSSTPRMSDFTVSGMLFKSTNPATSTNVWNLDYFLRIDSSNNTYEGIDSAFKTLTTTAQSVRLSNERVRFGNGYFLHCFIMIDVTIKDCLIENRSSDWGYSGGGIANTGMSNLTPNQTSNYNVRILNNVIEDVELAGVKLGNCVSSTISGNYMEANGSYFDLISFVSTNNNHNALTFSGNHIQQTTAQVTASVPGLDITNIQSSAGSVFKQRSNCSFSGNRALGILYKVTGNYYINSMGDFAAGTLCVPDTQLIMVAGVTALPVNGGVGALATTRSGIAYGYQKTFATTMSATTKQNYAIDVINAYFTNPITANSVVSVTVSDITNIKVHAYNWIFKSTNISTVNVCLENIDTVSHAITVYINVINLGE